MTYTEARKLFQRFEELGFGEESLEVDHDILSLIDEDEFDKLPEEVKKEFVDEGDWGEPGYKESKFGCFMEDGYLNHNV